MARETWVQSQVESYQRLKKWYLMSPCVTLSIIRYGSRVKWSNPGKGVALFPTPWCSSYRKGSLRVTLDYGRQLYLLGNWIKKTIHLLTGKEKVPNAVISKEGDANSFLGAITINFLEKGSTLNNAFNSLIFWQYLPLRKQRRINRKGHRNEANKSMDSYQ